MEFADTGLPKHPAIEQSFAALRRFDDEGDKYTSRGVLIAKLIAEHGVHKDPEAIAAGLLVPLAQDLGPFLCARADLPGRVPDIIQSLFDFATATMQGGATDSLYRELDPATKSVVLAASVRVFEVTATDLLGSLAARRKGLPPNATEENDDLKKIMAPIKAFTEMVTREEKDETALVAKCQEQIDRITTSLSLAGIKLPPAAKPDAPAP